MKNKKARQLIDKLQKEKISNSHKIVLLEDRIEQLERRLLMLELSKQDTPVFPKPYVPYNPYHPYEPYTAPNTGDPPIWRETITVCGG